MNSRELVDHIRSGPTELVLDKPLRFPPRSNQYDFNEFLQALETSETIRAVTCKSQLQLSITEDEWVLLIKTIGTIKGIDALRLYCSSGSRDFHPFQAIADAVNSAHSVCKLSVGLDGGTPLEGEAFLSDQSGLAALASALREHTTLQNFFWVEFGSGPEAELQVAARDPVLRVLPACPHLRMVTILTNYASTDAFRSLLQLTPATELRLILEPDQWLAVADEIRGGRCNIQMLSLTILEATKSEAIEAVKAVASAIQIDENLEYLSLQLEDGFSDEAGVALAEALTVNRTLRKVVLNANPVMARRDEDNRATLGARSYEAFGAMLSINTSVTLDLPTFDAAGADETDTNYYNQMRIELRLNKVGRGRLVATRQTPREEWVNALNELNSGNVDDSPEFSIGCLYCLLRLNPSVCLMEVNHTTNAGTVRKYSRLTP
jgi:hypothetical protein